MRLLYGTGNPAKLAYMKRQLSSLPIELCSLADMKTPAPVIPETGKSPLENARIKALAYYDAYQRPVFSCDTGLYFDEVPEEIQPGVQVRRIGGHTCSDEEMIAYYAALAARYGGALTAQYRNAVCLVMDNTHRYERMDASLSKEKFGLVSVPHPHRTPGFPLDSLSVELQSGAYYYDRGKGGTDSIASSLDFARFFQEAFRSFEEAAMQNGVLALL